MTNEELYERITSVLKEQGIGMTQLSYIQLNHA